MPEPLHLQYNVREAVAADYASTVEALTNAFEADPVMIKAVGQGHKAKRIADLFAYQIENIYGPKGAIDIAVTNQGQVLGAALWLSPEAQRGGLLGEIRGLPAYARVLGASLPSAVVTELRLLACRPKFSHWYLYTIGVHEDVRSHGIGRALLEYRLPRLGRYPAYLEASTYRSAALYRSCGFVELGEFAGGKPALGMWHPAPVSAIDSNA